ncbi:MAG: T9SS type A sorting domain-containing protein [Bacteroidales bacterium]|nr:T9SS type A sorting domain-containing protein [Bacteroidales bacterium]MDD4218465.1 T9SS type A sorting domain-containing protein [Bacteroidales bacterium]
MKKQIFIIIPLIIGLFLISEVKLFSQQIETANSNEPKGDFLGSISNNAVQSTKNVDAEISILMEGAKEEKAKRDKWSYHYKLSNGRHGAEIYSSPVNYFKNREWKPIIPILKNSNIEGYAYIFDEMNGRILIPQDNNGSTKIEFENNFVSFHSIGLRIVDGNTEIDLHNQKQIKPAIKISDKIVHFSNVYNNTTEHIELGNDMFSFHLLLEALPNYLNTISSSSDAYLEYDILVDYPTQAKPFGLSEDFISETGIAFVDENNNFVFNISQPIIFDSNHTSEYYEYKWKNIEHGKGILTMSVPVSWLKSTDRVFPVTIDPNVELYTTNSGYVEAATSLFGSPTVNLNNVMKTGGKITVNYSNDHYRGLASFNISSIPAGEFVFNHSLRLTSCYTNTGQFWVGYGITSNDPSTGTGSQLYNNGDIISYKTWNTTAVGTTEWHDYSMYNIIMTQQINSGQTWYGVKIVSAESNGSWPRINDAEVDFCAHNAANDGDKPMLFVEYDTPPSGNSDGCNVIAEASNYTINPGESVSITASGSLFNILLDNNFNNGSLGSGWEATTAATYSNPSCVGPSLDSTTFLWMGDASPHPRRLISQAFDVENGGWISFDLKYSVQGTSAPCEGPDEPQEGVGLEYSLDSGTTWIGIVYFHPQGYYTIVNPGTGGSNVASGTQTAFTTWANYVFAIPSGAFSSSTKFRWNQDGSSGALYDNWGLDNIIVKTPENASIYWEHNPTGGEELTVTPTQTTTYTAWITNGIDSCFSSITIVDNSQTYLVSYNVVNSNGTLIASVDGNQIASGTYVQANKSVIFTATPNVGYQVKEWTLNSNIVVGNTSNIFTIVSLQEVSVVIVEFISENVGISNNEKPKINIYPNPFNGIFTILSDDQYTMEIMDIQGRVILRGQIEYEYNELNMRSFSDGIYFIRLKNTNNSHVLQIHKMK